VASPEHGRSWAHMASKPSREDWPECRGLLIRPHIFPPPDLTKPSTKLCRQLPSAAGLCSRSREHETTRISLIPRKHFPLQTGRPKLGLTTELRRPRPRIGRKKSLHSRLGGDSHDSRNGCIPHG
jgi:hypothetical protein